MSYLQEVEQQQATSPEPAKKKRGRKVPEGRNDAIEDAYFVHRDSVKNIAAYFNVSVQTVYNIIRKGKQQQ